MNSLQRRAGRLQDPGIAPTFVSLAVAPFLGLSACESGSIGAATIDFAPRSFASENGKPWRESSGIWL